MVADVTQTRNYKISCMKETLILSFSQVFLVHVNYIVLLPFHYSCLVSVCWDRPQEQVVTATAAIERYWRLFHLHALWVTEEMAVYLRRKLCSQIMRKIMVHNIVAYQTSIPSFRNSFRGFSSQTNTIIPCKCFGKARRQYWPLPGRLLAVLTLFQPILIFCFPESSSIYCLWRRSALLFSHLDLHTLP